jgi:hypothetical protein
MTHDYVIDTLDFHNGLTETIPRLGEMCFWERRFGYKLDAVTCNLDALIDGFDFEFPPGRGRVLELNRADSAFVEDPEWLLGFLNVISIYSLRQLAIGRRFFALIVVADLDSPLVGATFGRAQVPGPFWGSFREEAETERGE